MRILEQKKIEYKMNAYDSSDGRIDGISVAEKIGRDPSLVYKTLVCQGGSGDYYVFVIPVAEELDLKKSARAAGEKKVEMIHVKDIQKVTGYIRGGCSPIGMKKEYRTIVDSSAESIGSIIVSGGRIGTQIELNVGDLLKAANAELAEIAKR
jgi:Cys-tRNA(Pro)/Cys-tRNA(Cys) deacylase